MSPDLLRRTEMKSKAGAQCGSAPRDPPGNGCDRWRQRQRCCAERGKFPCGAGSACGTVYKRKSNFMLCNALSRYTSIRSSSASGTTGHLSRCGSVRRGSWFPLGTNSIPRPCFAALEGKAKSARRIRAARIADERFLPRTRKLSPLCTTSLVFVSPGLPVLRGVSGGGAALSPGF